MPHDFRNWQKAAVSPEQAEQGEWAEVDADWSYTVLARIGPPGSDPADGVSTTFSTLLPAGWAKGSDYVAFYGSRGTIHVDKAYCQGALYLWQEGRDGFVEVPVPDELLASLPPVERRANWGAGWEVPQTRLECLARDFVADIEDRPHQHYLTIEDGWRHQEAIDAVRADGRMGGAAVGAVVRTSCPTAICCGTRCPETTPGPERLQAASRTPTRRQRAQRPKALTAVR